MAVHVIVGSGRVGRALAAALACDGEEVRLVDRRPVEPPPNVAFFRADVRDGDRMQTALEGAERVCFCAVAATPPASRRSLEAVNVAGLARVLATARRLGVERTVVVSTSLVDGPPGAASAPGVYGRSRRAAERVAGGHIAAGDPVVVLRPHIVVDEHPPCLFAAQFDHLAAGTPVPWPLAWDAAHHLIHTDDLVAACRRALDAEATGFYGVGSRVTGGLRQLFEALARRHGLVLRIRPRGQRRARLLLRLEELAGWCLLGPGELMLYTEGLTYDLQPAERGLGWRPRRTDAEILDAAFAAHRSRAGAATTGSAG